MTPESKPNAILQYLEWATQAIESPAEVDEAPQDGHEIEAEIEAEIEVEPPSHDARFQFPVPFDAGGFHAPPMQHHGQGMHGWPPFDGGFALQPPTTSGGPSFLAPQHQDTPAAVQQHAAPVGAHMDWGDDAYSPSSSTDLVDQWLNVD